MRKKIALYFGSFNPIHNGHLTIANYCVENYGFDELWLVVSPQNPFKKPKDLLSFEDRVLLCKAATEWCDKIFVTDIEGHMPTPSYTIDTLAALPEENDYTIIIGDDAFSKIDEWKDFEKILSNYSLLVLPRDGDKVFPRLMRSDGYEVLDGVFPTTKMSSSFVRSEIQKGHDIIGYVPESVSKIIKEKSLYNFVFSK